MGFNIVKAPHIFMPKKGVDLNKYAVIACDQFTSQIEYWDKLKKEIGDSVSTFHMIFPEAYLSSVDNEEYIKGINKNIEIYLNNKDIVDIGECFILVERVTSYGVRRLGLVISIDLEEYSYKRDVPCSIKASEATIVERIPPRLKIRKDAAVEFPHTLLLFDDKEKSIVEPLYAKRNQLPLVYDFELNANGGHIRGYRLDNTKEIIKQFEDLYNKNNSGLMFIVGDGNHSLATAKAHWENVKSSLTKEEQLTHPARYALVEVNNIYDDGIVFEPIHRVLFNVEEDVLEGLKHVMMGNSKKCHIYTKKLGKFPINCVNNAAEVYQKVQAYLDEYLKTHKDTSIDFVHDEESAIEIANKDEKSVAIIMPAIGKDDLFVFVAKDAVLPRKSFSMGHASEKRYYLESKKIIG